MYTACMAKTRNTNKQDQGTDKDGYAKRIRLVVVPESDIPDCSTCGACCTPAYYGDHKPVVHQMWADLNWSDIEKLTDEEKNLGVIAMPASADNMHYPTLGLAVTMTKAGVVKCVFHEGTIGKNSVCTIYDRRPVVCHKYQAGSLDCLETRKSRGLKAPKPSGKPYYKG